MIQVALEDGRLVLCKVIERMGFNHDVGARTAWVAGDGREFMAVCPRGGTWRKWTAADRTQPIREWLVEEARRSKERLDRAGEGG